MKFQILFNVLILISVANSFSQPAFYNANFEKMDVQNVFYFKKALSVEDVGIATYELNGQVLMEIMDKETTDILGFFFEDITKIDRSQLRYLQNDSRMQSLVAKYESFDIANRIYKGTVFISMTKEQAEDSWGKPDEVNRTITENLVSEQWVYENRQYLYFENGILTTIQD